VGFGIKIFRTDTWILKDTAYKSNGKQNISRLNTNQIFLEICQKKLENSRKEQKSTVEGKTEFILV